MGVLGDLFFATLIGLIGFAGYETLARSATAGARAIIKVLIGLSMLFSLVIVTWDLVAGTATSTESFVVIIAAAPLLVAIGLVVIVDRMLSQMRKR